MSDELIKKIEKNVIRDYFTPNIKAEVILDMLLTDYISGILEHQLNGLKLTFLTKEMSIDDNRGNNQGAKTDYIFEDENNVYMVELKTTTGSLKESQWKAYIDSCHSNNSNNIKPDFGSVLGKRLTDILINYFGDINERNLKELEAGTSPKGDWNFAKLIDAFKLIFTDSSFNKCKCTTKRDCKFVNPTYPFEEAALKFIKFNGWAQNENCKSRKYLYTLGQLIDNHSKIGGELWDKKLRLIYITPYGDEPWTPTKGKEDDAKDKYEADKAKYSIKSVNSSDIFYIYPKDLKNEYGKMLKSVSLRHSIEYLKTQGEYGMMIADILNNIFPDRRDLNANNNSSWCR